MKGAVTVAAFLVLVARPLPAAALEGLPTVPAGSADRLVAPHAHAMTTWFELLAEAVPGVRRVSILVMVQPPHDHDGAAWSAIAVAARQAARRRALHPEIMTVRHRGDLLDAFVMMTQSRIDGVVVLPTRAALDQAAEVAALATRHHLPLIGGHRRFVDSGALMSYGGRGFASRSGCTNGFVEGAKPPDATPVGPPTRFELLINGNTARALDLTIPPALRLRADQIID